MNLVIKSAIDDLISIDSYLQEREESFRRELGAYHLPQNPEEIRSLKDVREEYVINAVKICGSATRAARLLGMSKSNVSRYVRKHNGK